MKKKRLVGREAVRKGYCDPNCKRVLRNKVKEARLTDHGERLVKLREAQTLARATAFTLQKKERVI